MTPIDPQAPIAQRIDTLLALAQRHGEAFRSPEAWLARQRYQARHPSAIAALMCMDGRVNLALACQLPAGIVLPLRNLGGMFNLGWPYLQQVLRQQLGAMVQAGRRVLLLITYHWSAGDVRRGCAGFHYDRGASLEHAWAIRTQVGQLFGSAHQSVYPLVCGFETDLDALRLHSPSGATLDTAELSDSAATTLDPALAALFPDLPAPMRADLLPLLRGNLAHVAEVRRAKHERERELALEHGEWVLCLGRGFDFLHTPNLALIVGPYSPDLAHPIRTAAGLIEANMQAGRIGRDGFLLLSSMPYTEQGPERAGAALKARFLAHFGSQVIEHHYPQLARGLQQRCAVLDWPTRRLELIAPHEPLEPPAAL